MRRRHKMLVGLMSLCMIFQTGSLDARAAAQAPREPYTYQVTFYAGNHGSFSGSGYVSVDNSKSDSSYRVEGNASSIVVSGLSADDMVSFDAAALNADGSNAAVVLETGSKYYVKGIRESGRDNSTVSNSAIRADHDQDYVVAYGIRGEMTTYTVNYQDTSGRTLAQSRTYFGNVGDRPVVAYLYIAGYQPQAYNLTRTLVQNTAENVFTFVYSRVRTPSNPSGGGSGSGVGSGSSGSGGGGGGTAAPAAPADTPAPGETPAPAGGGAVVVPGGADDGTAPAGAEAGDVEVPDEEVPQSEPEVLVDLDDTEVPLADVGEMLQDEGVRVTSGAIAITVAAIAAFIFLIFWAKRRAKAKADEE